MPRLMRIADGYDTLALTLAVTGLEGAGFTVLTPGRHTDSILPNTSAALGPVPILVPEAEAAEAMDFLRAIPADGVRVLDQPRYLPGQDPAAAPATASGGRISRLWQRLLARAGSRPPAAPHLHLVTPARPGPQAAQSGQPSPDQPAGPRRSAEPEPGAALGRPGPDCPGPSRTGPAAPKPPEGTR